MFDGSIKVLFAAVEHFSTLKKQNITPNNLFVQSCDQGYRV